MIEVNVLDGVGLIGLGKLDTFMKPAYYLG